MVRYRVLCPGIMISRHCPEASVKTQGSPTWAMNAAASVLGSVLAMVIAIEFGLTVTLACGAAAYLLALLLLPSLRSQRA